MGRSNLNQNRNTLVVSFLVLLQCSGLFADENSCRSVEIEKLIGSTVDAADRFGSAVSVSDGRAIVGAWRGDGAASESGTAYVFRRDHNATPSDPTDDFWVEEAELVASNGGPGDLYGWSVAISGDRAVVGARFHPFPPRSGVAYVFRRDDNGTPLEPGDDVWKQEDILIASDAASGDEFGIAVAIDGDSIVVGASENDDACRDNPDVDCDSGSAYIFRRDDNGSPFDPTDDHWIEEGKLLASDESAGDNFGFSVSIWDERVVVGAWHNDEGGNDSGSAYVFRHSDGTLPTDPSDDFWTEEDKLMASDGAPNDNFGISVSVYGDRAIVGSWLDDDGGSLSGSAYIFIRQDNGTPTVLDDDFWVEEDKLTATDAKAGDEFGKSVSIHGDRVVVGAFEDDDACGDLDPECDSGAAYVFVHNDNGTPLESGDDRWIQTLKMVASDSAAQKFFGRAALGDDHVLVGSLDNDAGAGAGAIYVFLAEQECGDLADFAGFQNCMSGSSGDVFQGCEVYEYDGDGDIDLDDFDRFVFSMIK